MIQMLKMNNIFSMFTDTVITKINELEKEGIHMDQFATILVPSLVFNRLQRDFINKWGKWVVTHKIDQVRWVKLSTIPTHNDSYEKVFLSENEIIVYSWKPFMNTPFKRRIELAEFLTN